MSSGIGSDGGSPNQTTLELRCEVNLGQLWVFRYVSEDVQEIDYVRVAHGQDKGSEQLNSRALSQKIEPAS